MKANRLANARFSYARLSGTPDYRVRPTIGRQMKSKRSATGINTDPTHTHLPTGEEVDMHKAPIGSVMIVGGGIAGIQAALDLADSGYYVYLVEKGPGIGGGMAQLDKTFPTNDCSM
jgi:NADPH-dependent 2,4-dienoyl-CoA reductase/sulfur reductase-like enzyme